MITERRFDILRRVKADWDEIDAFVANTIAADKNNEIDSIVISWCSVKDGVLCENFIPIICVKEYPSEELESAVVFKTPVDWVREDMLPHEHICLWERNSQRYLL